MATQQVGDVRREVAHVRREALFPPSPDKSGLARGTSPDLSGALGDNPHVRDRPVTAAPWVNRITRQLFRWRIGFRRKLIFKAPFNRERFYFLKFLFPRAAGRDVGMIL